MTNRPYTTHSSVLFSGYSSGSVCRLFTPKLLTPLSNHVGRQFYSVCVWVCVYAGACLRVFPCVFVSVWVMLGAGKCEGCSTLFDTQSWESNRVPFRLGYWSRFTCWSQKGKRPVNPTEHWLLNYTKGTL